MKGENHPEVPDHQAVERQRQRDMRRAVAFGVVMATIQMSVLLYFMYC